MRAISMNNFFHKWDTIAKDPKVCQSFDPIISGNARMRERDIPFKKKYIIKIKVSFPDYSLRDNGGDK